MKKNYSIALLVASSLALASSATLFASETDDRIESSAKKSHVFKTYLKDDSIKTVSKDGFVTLSGTVSEPNHKSIAQDTVESLPGVKSVDNQLKVKNENVASQSDAWIGIQVTTALLFHSNVRATKTDVNVKNGIVTLSGEAASLAQKELTTEYTNDIEGVKEVRNEMTVAKNPKLPEATMGEKMDDASITAQVKWSLLAHRSTSALKTKIETKDGVVKVNGIAKNDAEKSLVTKLISGINGVTTVINNMSVGVTAASNQ